ncbi:uncharacterized protein PGTG_03234 [Puccinia graminis f. sp. tritici CRL 75-36-700-3]|uniref:Hydrophobin n=1 Tax=Puccinia graminis f. sp. tritici (strain CRL 75-36-700-3 / race SCCL) TaxID=418459 RepID=E3JZ03_PUCGT|nr:uncharacterized protein PGTG_03234 [Puccinia graminis f. sp. tritici CRL 75-36-700-3]EFP77278.2 hypothetical protein PGTG_03234 [Puccinia graminis f. sp. tritici CRL 75-36-700-3]
MHSFIPLVFLVAMMVVRLEASSYAKCLNGKFPQPVCRRQATGSTPESLVGITAVFQDSFTCSANKNDAKPWKCCDDTTFAIGTVRYDITESLKYCQTATPV